MSTDTGDTKVQVKYCGIPNMVWIHFTIEMVFEIRVEADRRILHADSFEQESGESTRRSDGARRVWRAEAGRF